MPFTDIIYSIIQDGADMDAQKFIRLSNCLSVISSTEAAKHITRKEIAEQTGLSLMTVGKLCDLLCEAEFIESKKEDKNASGRKASVCNMHPALYTCVLNLCGSIYSLNIYDPNGRACLTLTHSPASSISYGDGISQFADRMADMLTRLPHPKIVGMIAIANGKYDEETGSLLTFTGESVPIKEIVSVIAEYKYFCTVEAASAAAAYAEKANDGYNTAVTVEKHIAFAAVSPFEPFGAKTVFPNSLRAEGTGLAERAEMLGAPDVTSLYCFFCALYSFLPECKAKIYLLSYPGASLPDPLDVITDKALRDAGMQNKAKRAEEPAKELTEGARYVLLKFLLEKHI